jgi:hypothetical protein
MSSDSLASLCGAWLDAKKRETAAAEDRVAIEDKIVAITGKRDEGSQTVNEADFKLTITGKVTRKMDWDKWEHIKSQIPPNLHPIKLKPELDDKGVKYLQANEPEIYRLLPIETRPAKTSVAIVRT